MTNLAWQFDTFGASLGPIHGHIRHSIRFDVPHAGLGWWVSLQGFAAVGHTAQPGCDVKVLGAKHSLGVLDLQRAAHVARSSTIWAKNTKENGTYTERRGGRGDYEWNEEVIHLYVKDPGAQQHNACWTNKSF